MISIKNVHKQFGKQKVLNGLSLEIPTGTSIAIVGPSGVGKSVLLKLILGIISPDQGTIKIFDDVMSSAVTESEKNLIRKQCGVLYQSAALLDSKTIVENVSFPLFEQRFNGDNTLSTHEIMDKTQLLLEELSLTQYQHALPQEVSLGVRKRVGLARAVITKPKIILIDEPNTGLDPLNGQEVYDLINSLREKTSCTGVVISHEIPEVFQVVDRVAMIFNGKIFAYGTPEEIKESRDPYVQQFLHGSITGPITIN